MKIEISVQEYFNELKLMEKHYGQEEDLYPWIYMLLQMAECKKEEILKDWYGEVSIRDVHNDSRADGDKENTTIREKIVLNGAVPDFLVVDMKSKKFFGCVEIKQFVSGQKLQSLNVSEHGEYTIYYIKEFTNSVIVPKEEVDNICNQINKNHPEWNIKRDDKYDNKIWLNYPQAQITKKDLLQYVQCEIEKEKLIKITSKPKYMAINKGWKPTSEIISHLKQYKKLIYTNGLEFYYLEWKSEKENNGGNLEITVDVTELANLANLYENYKSEGTNASTLLEAAAEWDKLIAGLTKINWHAEPTTLISEDSK